ncbi:DUF6764 family protein [Antrihabitans spumae]|uniref:DUF6764 family protein n=1 Tax=Antrihabitans spumae TaxID=3373370 RepID=A0ABW7K3E7_9NOCA
MDGCFLTAGSPQAHDRGPDWVPLSMRPSAAAGSQTCIGEWNGSTQGSIDRAIIVGGGLATAAAALAIPTTAAAAPTGCQSAGAGLVTNSSNVSGCSATAVPGSAAAAYGTDGVATSAAGSSGLALAIATAGGTASALAQNLSGPAAIAMGPGAEVTALGVRPGLSLGIAGPGAKVTIDGVTGPTCTGGPGVAADFQTLQSCLSLQ